MKNILIIILSALCVQSFCQIEYKYDDAGNRYLRREFTFKSQNIQDNDTSSTTDSSAVVKNEYSYKLPNDASITAYPNPAQSTLNIQTVNINSFEYSLTDYSGRALISGKSSSTSDLIDLSMLPAGNYILITIADGSKREWKIIKE